MFYDTREMAVMKILIVSKSDIRGGAAKAAYRLHRGLLGKNLDSQMLVQEKLSDDHTVISNITFIEKVIAKILPFIDRLPLKLYLNKKKSLFSASWFPSPGIIKKINRLNPDIVLLQWICEGMIKIENLAKIKAPIVWTLHDMWAFTGGCHYDNFCGKYKDKCGSCPLLGSNNNRDLSYRIWKKKKKTLQKIENITIIGLSSWIVERAKESSILKSKNIVKLLNPMDTEVFRPFDKLKARELWNLPANKKLILFGAIKATDDLRKGFKKLIKSLKMMENTDHIELVVFGESEPPVKPNIKLKITYTGHLNDDISLITLYSAVDVMLVPSLQDVCPLTAIESLACGTPVIAFENTGLADIVNHKINGYLAKHGSPESLFKGLNWILDLTSSEYEDLCNAGRKKIISEFNDKIIAEKYIKLFKSIMRQ